MGRLNNMVVVADATGKLTYVSPSAERILGFTPDELANGLLFDLAVTNNAERRLITRNLRSMANRRVAPRTIPSELKMRSRYGSDKWMKWETLPGPGRTVIGIGQDITEQKNAEYALHEKNEALNELHNNLLGSLEYARRIQEMILPEPEKLNRHVTDSFILYKPRDIVSGDFYWFSKEGNRLYLAIADSTGHGVPGAMVSVLGSSVLRDVIRKYGMQEPSRILEHLDVEMVYALTRESGQGLKDGMDIALAVIDLDDMVLEFSGAFRGMTHVGKNGLQELLGARYPIGQYDEPKQFTTTCIQLEAGDRIYMYTDGFTDQFGGEHDKKFNRKRLKELLVSVQDMPMEEQSGFIDYALNNWKQETPQTDDMLMMGVEV